MKQEEYWNGVSEKKEFTNDIDGLFEIMSNPQVHQYTKDKNHPWDRLRTERYIQFFVDKTSLL